jgi:multicomponent Na+:H+ antiporter subunit D
MSALLPLLVALPLVGAVVPFVLGGRARRLARAATAGILLAQVGLAAAVTVLVAGGPLRTVIGGLPAAVGIGLRADAVSAVFALFVALSGAVLYLTVRTDGTGPTDSLWLLFVAGLTGMTLTADVFNLYVFLEISGLAAYALVASRRGTAAALAALQYLLVGTVGATFYLLGVGYLYVATGTLAMADLRTALPAVGYDSPLVVAAFAFLTLGLGVKLALFPLHTWKPDAYAAAAPDVTALLAAVGSTIPGYALVRLTFDVFTVDFLRAVPAVRTGLVALGLVSVAAGGYLTLRQSNVRRLLAYSSVLQIGLVVVGIGLATPAAVTGALVVLLANGLAKAGLFVAAGSFEADGFRTVADYAGRARASPVTAAAVTVSLLSLVGLPPTAGFAGKWYLAVAAVETRSWLATAVVLLSTLVSLAYTGRIIERLYLPGSGVGPAATDGGRPADPVRGGRLSGVARSRAALLVAGVAAGTVLLGLGSTLLADWMAPVVEGWL